MLAPFKTGSSDFFFSIFAVLFLCFEGFFGFGGSKGRAYLKLPLTLCNPCTSIPRGPGASEKLVANGTKMEQMITAPELRVQKHLVAPTRSLRLEMTGSSKGSYVVQGKKKQKTKNKKTYRPECLAIIKFPTGPASPKFARFCLTSSTLKSLRKTRKAF